MVNLLDGSESAFLKTHLAEGMLLCVAVADSFPRSAVGLVHFRGAFIFIVFLPCLFAVLLTVLSVCEVGTTGVGTRSLGSARHLVTSVPGKRKAHAGGLST